MTTRRFPHRLHDWLEVSRQCGVGAAIMTSKATITVMTYHSNFVGWRKRMKDCPHHKVLSDNLSPEHVIVRHALPKG